MIFPALLFFFLAAGDWTMPVEVTHDDKPVISYRARLTGGHLLVEAKLEPGWHTFTLDNDKRAAEKLAGKKALGVDRPTTVEMKGLNATGPWLQSEPKDFSQPEIRMFTWGFENHALLAVPVKKAAGAAELHIRGQACTAEVCKNIDVTLPLPAGSGTAAPDLTGLVAVR
jgi:DsbC/DsbD-like thiol-disulfide interchange protein